jgi:hypothetical protein
LNLAIPCDEQGNFLLPGSQPIPKEILPHDDWYLFRNRVEFELVEFLFMKNQMPASQINTLLDLWSAYMVPYGGTTPFTNARDLYETIDTSPLGDIKWESFSIKYEGKVPERNPPSWMMDSFEVWYRNPHQVIKSMLANTDFKEDIDPIPFHEYDQHGERQYCNLMSGDWAWTQVVGIIHFHTEILI